MAMSLFRSVRFLNMGLSQHAVLDRHCFHRPISADLEVPSEIVETDTLQGDLSTTPLPDLLQRLSADSRSGLLRLANGGELWLDQGRVYLSTTAASADIGSVLFGAGVGGLDEIGELLDSSHDVAGQLADRDPSAAPILERLLHEHNLTGLFELLVPQDGPFKFEDGQRHPLGGRFSEPTAELISQAQRRLDIWRQIAARIPSTAVAFCLSRTLPDKAEERIVTADEWRYLSLLDSHRSVADVINVTGESAFRVCSSLYRLLLEGVIEEVVAEPSA